MTLLDFVDHIAEKALQQPEKYIKPGHNGPYVHPETPLRNKGHWLITFCKLYEWTGKEAYKHKAAELAEHLLSKEARPYGYSFYHRNTPKKDRCNGLVGQAWTFEALAQATRTFEDHTFNKLAEEVFLQHHFNQKHALWNILEVDGRILPIDNAFNHQLWFAAGISLVNNKHSEIAGQVTAFLDKIFDNVTILEDGLIYHEFDFEPEDLYGKRHKAGITGKVKQQLKYIFSFHKRDTLSVGNLTPEEKKEKLWIKMKYKSIGYHAFNTYAFGLLRQQYPAHPIWQHELLKKIANYLLTEEYKLGVKDNKFSFSYNPPGFEVPFSAYALLESDLQHLQEVTCYWIDQQLQICYNKETSFFDINNEDPVTLTARIYEVTRLSPQVLRAVSVSNKYL